MEYGGCVYIMTNFHNRIEDAIAREKQLKAGSRRKKEDLIHELNPHWNDLWEEVKTW